MKRASRQDATRRELPTPFEKSQRDTGTEAFLDTKITPFPTPHRPRDAILERTRPIRHISILSRAMHVDTNQWEPSANRAARTALVT